MKSSLSSLISVYPVESCQKRSVDEVGKDDEGVGLVQVEQEDGCDEGHALDTDKVNLRPLSLSLYFYASAT